MSSTFSNWKTDNYKFVGKAFDFAYADRLNKLSPVVGEVNARSIDYELTGSGGYGEAPAYDGDNLNQVQHPIRNFRLRTDGNPAADIAPACQIAADLPERAGINAGVCIVRDEDFSLCSSSA